MCVGEREKELHTQGSGHLAPSGRQAEGVHYLTLCASHGNYLRRQICSSVSLSLDLSQKPRDVPSWPPLERRAARRMRGVGSIRAWWEGEGLAAGDTLQRGDKSERGDHEVQRDGQAQSVWSFDGDAAWMEVKDERTAGSCRPLLACSSCTPTTRARQRSMRASVT